MGRDISRVRRGVRLAYGILLRGAGAAEPGSEGGADGARRGELVRFGARDDLATARDAGGARREPHNERRDSLGSNVQRPFRGPRLRHRRV